MPVHSQHFCVLAPLEQIPTCSYLLSISDSILSLLLFPFFNFFFKADMFSCYIQAGAAVALPQCNPGYNATAIESARLKHISSNYRSLPWRDAPLRGGRSGGRRATLVTDHLTMGAQCTLPLSHPSGGFLVYLSVKIWLSYSTTVAPTPPGGHQHLSVQREVQDKVQNLTRTGSGFQT